MNFNGVIAVAEKFPENSAINSFDLCRIIEFLIPVEPVNGQSDNAMEWLCSLLHIVNSYVALQAAQTFLINDRKLFILNLNIWFGQWSFYLNKSYRFQDLMIR